MAIKVQRNKINFKGKMINIGIDMHKRSWRITALSEGDIVMGITLAKPTYDDFKKVLVQFKCNYVRIVYEAGPGGFDLYDRLTADVIECIVTPPFPYPHLFLGGCEGGCPNVLPAGDQQTTRRKSILDSA